MQCDSPLLEVFQRLYGCYGPQGWWPAQRKFEVIVGAILTQAISWTGVERAIENMRAAGVFSLEGLTETPAEELARLVRPCLYYNVKASKLKAFAAHLWRHHQGDLEAFLSQDAPALRQELLSIYGIGEETADDILLYAAERPYFVIDAYTRRIVRRLGMAPAREDYRSFQGLFHRGLPREASLFNEYHALLDRHAKESCRKRPLCSSCCLLELCPTGQGTVASEASQEWSRHNPADKKSPNTRGNRRGKGIDNPIQ